VEERSQVTWTQKRARTRAFNSAFLRLIILKSTKFNYSIFSTPASSTMAKKFDTFHVVKLDDSNYQRWKLQVSLILKASEVWPIVSGALARPGAADVADRKDWDLKDIQAQAIIVPLVDKKQTNHIYTCTTIHAIWTKLEPIHSDESSLNKQHTLSRFFNYQVGPNISVLDAYSEKEDLARCLNEMGIKME